jgi:hypothetical protein
VSRSRRVRRDGLPAMLAFVTVPFAALFLAMAAHPAGLLDSEREIRERTEGWRPKATAAAREAGVPLDLLLALVATESSGRDRARARRGRWASPSSSLRPRAAWRPGCRGWTPTPSTSTTPT